ncbi:MAG: hypothetical protein IJZ08_07760 [Clostridia bacterium]|nr:hypothetical protein [Clostridia bacterium]
MKNPIQHVKHLWKDPINNIEEANTRKKEVMPWLLGSVGAAVLFCGLGGALGIGILSVFGFVGIVGVMVFGFLLFIVHKAKEKFNALTCDKCNTMAVIKTPEEFEKYVSYTVGGCTASYDGIKHPASNNGVVATVEAKGSAAATVAIDLKCPHCGERKKLAYHIVPFKCSVKEEKVAVRDLESVKSRIETAVKSVVADYNDPEKRESIPYSIHSRKHPDYENRTKPQLGGPARYNGVSITYHKDPKEMVEQYFLQNQVDGKMVDCSKSKKK